MAGRYITDGSAARVVRNTENQRYRTKRELMQRTREAEERERRSRRNPQAALLLTIILIAAMAVLLYFGYNYLCLQSSVNERMENIKVLETRLEKLKTENDAFEQSIDTSVDLNYVYNVAINELGMVHAGQDNIIRYEKNESEYVRQYDSIPSF